MKRLSWLSNNSSTTVAKFLKISISWIGNFSCSIAFVLIASGCVAQATITDQYENLSREFIKSYRKGNMEDAYNSALKQLELDPSDSEAFLRLSLAIDTNCNKVKPYF